MASSVQYKLEGADQIIKALDVLDSKELISLIKSAERKALAQEVIKPIKAALPYSAATKKGIKIVADKEDRLTGLYAGVSSDAFWLRFLEGGTKIRTTKNRANRGQIAPRPITKPIIINSADGVIDFFNKDFGQTLVTLMQRKIKRIKK